MAARKTIDVEWLKYKVNLKLKNEATDRNLGEEKAAIYKRALCDLLETALSHSENYRGFGYLDENYVADIRRTTGYRDHREYRRHYY